MSFLNWFTLINYIIFILAGARIDCIPIPGPLYHRCSLFNFQPSEEPHFNNARAWICGDSLERPPPLSVLLLLLRLFCGWYYSRAALEDQVHQHRSNESTFTIK